MFNNKKARDVGWKFLLGLGGLFIILYWLGGGAILSIFTMFSSPFLLITIGIFVLIWMLRKK